MVLYGFSRSLIKQLKQEITLIIKHFFLIGGECPRRRVDVQTIYNYLTTNGLTPTSKIQKADVIIIYTCGAFNKSEKKSIRTIVKTLKKKSHNSKVFITGCLLKINPKSIERFNGTTILKRKELCNLDSVINSKVSFKEITDASIIGNIPYLYDDSLLRKFKDNFLLDPVFFSEGLRAIKKISKNFSFFDSEVYNLLISRGCLSNCTYCAVKLAQGELCSKPSNEIVKEFQKAIDKGHNRFVLIGADVGCYGMDRKTDIVTLLTELFSINGNYQIEFSGINARWLIRYFDKLMALLEQHFKKIRNVNIPIQSGSNRILKLMRRGYSIDQVKECLLEIRRRIPDLPIHTHILVGFPGETHEDFEETCKLLSEFHFDHIALYPYDDRQMTKAYHLQNKLPKNIIKKRAFKIRRIISSSGS